WPGKVKAGTMTGQMGHIIDILPTCLEMAGGNYLKEFAGKGPLPLEGKSLLTVLQGGVREAPQQICWEWAGNCAIRQGKWKMVWDTLNKAKKWELYDMEADRTELNDLAGRIPEKVKELGVAYEKWAKSTGRRLPGEKGKSVED